MPPMPNAVRGIALVLLLVLLPSAGAQGMDDPSDLLEADRAGTVLFVNLTASGRGDVDVRVRHLDPLFGYVEDRNVTADLSSGRARLAFEDMPAEWDVQVVVYERGQTLAVETAPPVHGTLYATSPVRDVAAWRDGTVNEAAPRLLVTRDGVLVVGWIEDGALGVVTSRDGGATWSPRQVLTPEGEEGAWDMGLLDDGRVSIVYRRYGDFSAPWRLLALEPFSGAVAREVVATNGFVLEPNHWGSLLATPRGAFAAISEYGLGTRILSITSEGGEEQRALIPWSNATAPRLGGDGTRLGLSMPEVGTGGRPLVTRSEDGGRTWTFVRVVPGVVERDPIGVRMAATPAFSDDGVMHLVFSAAREREGYGSHEGYYVRVGEDGEILTSRRLNGDDEDVSTPAVAAHGNRVWLLPSLTNAAMTWRASSDGGSTFGVEYRQQPAPWSVTSSMWWTETAAVAPDGRLLFLADRYEDGGLRLVLVTPFAEVRSGNVTRPEPPTTTPPVPTPTPITVPTVAPPSAATPAAPTAQAAARVDVTVLPSRVMVGVGASANVTLVVTNHGDPVTLGPAFLGGALPYLTAQLDDPRGTRIGTEQSVSLRLVVRADVKAEVGTRTTLTVNLTDSADGSLFVGVPIPADVVAATVPTPPAPGPDGGAGGLSDLGLGLAAGGAVAAGAALVALARTDVGKIAGAVATLPLYTRLVKQDVLQHEVRQGVYEHVSRNPGARFEELRKALQLSNGVLVFHLRVLQQHGLVTVHREWTRRRFYATGARPAAPAEGVAGTLVGLLRSEPGLGPAEVARRLGISRQLARYHLQRLEREGAILADRDGGVVAYRVPR